MQKLFDDESSTTQEWDMNDVKKYVETYMEYENQIKTLQESRREWSKEFIDDKNLPKKELGQALSLAKKDLDVDLTFEIHSNIATMCGQD